MVLVFQKVTKHSTDNVIKDYFPYLYLNFLHWFLSLGFLDSERDNGNGKLFSFLVHNVGVEE